MTLPASGQPISLSQIQAEFGGVQPISLSEYYRGGPNVGVTGTTTTIPSSGTISFDQFHGESGAGGGGGLVVSISPNFAYAAGTGLSTTGAVTASVSGGTAPYTYSWTKVSGTTMTVTGPTSASTQWRYDPAVNEQATAVYKCTVTDHVGVTGFDTVGVEVDWDNGL